MTIKFSCDNCDQELSTAELLNTCCPKCGKWLKVKRSVTYGKQEQNAIIQAVKQPLEIKPLCKLVDKKEITELAAEYDNLYKDKWVLPELRLGAKFRQEKEITKADLKEVVEWKFTDLPWKADTLSKVEELSDGDIRQKSRFVFCDATNDYDRINGLRFPGVIGPSIISAILTFYNPKDYGVFDRHVWRAFFGQESSETYLWTTENFLRVLEQLRKIANQYAIDVRTVEKAVFLKQRGTGP